MLKVVNAFKAIYKKQVNMLQHWYILLRNLRNGEVTLGGLTVYKDRRQEVYFKLHAFFYLSMPEIFRSHRRYFALNMRGFGEDAFHAFWYLLFCEYTPKRCLEIGVYRGQCLSLWALLGQFHGYRPEVVGLSPLNNLSDTVSSYPNLDYLEDIYRNHDHFNLTHPLLIRESSESQAARDCIVGKDFDLIYIDGGHDFSTVVSDYILAKQSLVSGGLLVMDDSSLYTNYDPPSFAFKGHPGPSRVMSEKVMADKDFEFLIGVGHLNVFKKIN